MKNRLVSPELVAQFASDGFVVIPNLLTDEEIARFQPAVRRGVAHRKQFDTRSLKDKSLYEQSFLQCINLWEDFEDVRPLTFHPRIAEAAAELIGAEAVRLFHDQALFKEAGGRETDPHQDLPYWPIVENDALTAWVPFDGSTLQNGCMGYARGSHKAGKRKFVNIFRAGVENPKEQAQELITSNLVYVEVPKGSVAFHHGLTAHDAKPNMTTKTREVHTMIFFRDGCTRSPRGKHDVVDRLGVKVGEPIASAVTPIAWPRPAGDLPDRPPPPSLSELPEGYRYSGTFPGASAKA